MWHLRTNDGTINYLFHTTKDLIDFITAPVYARIKYEMEFVRVWQPAAPKPPSEREIIPAERFPEPLSGGNTK